MGELCKVKAFPFAAPSPHGHTSLLPSHLASHPMYMPPSPRSPPCFSWPRPCYSHGQGLCQAWTLCSMRTGPCLVCPPLCPWGPRQGLACSRCTYVFSHCLQGEVGSDWPRRAGDGTGHPLLFFFPWPFRLLPRGSWPSGKLRGALARTHLPSTDPRLPHPSPSTRQEAASFPPAPGLDRRPRPHSEM